MTNTDPEDPERARALAAHALCQYVASLSSPATVSTANDRPTVVGMALVLPALLARALSEGEEVYRETSGRLLELASADQGAFRAVVGAMGEGQRGFMEEVIRSGRGAEKGGVREEGVSREPTIALKMDFGG